MAYYTVLGGWGGETATAWTDGMYSDIKSMVIRHGTVIDAIQVNYAVQDKTHAYTVSAPQHGLNGGSPSTIELEEGEYITKLSGTVDAYTEHGMGVVVFSLKFTTSTGRILGPYGSSERGTPFETKINGKITGFFGRSHQFLEQIGVYLVHL